MLLNRTMVASRDTMSGSLTEWADRGEASGRAAGASDGRVGRRIRETRLARGRTLKELAYDIGVTAAQLHRYEMGTTRIVASRLIMIAGALDVTPESFLEPEKGGNEEPVPDPAGPPDAVDDLLELIHILVGLKDPAHRRALLTIARMMSDTHPR